MDPAKPKRIRQLMGSEMVSPVIDAMSRSDEMLSIMRQLIGPDVYLFHSKLMMKAARDGSFVTGGVKPGHQTGAYGRPWRSKTRPAPYLFV